MSLIKVSEKYGGKKELYIKAIKKTYNDIIQIEDRDDVDKRLEFFLEDIFEDLLITCSDEVYVQRCKEEFPFLREVFSYSSMFEVCWSYWKEIFDYSKSFLGKHPTDFIRWSVKQLIMNTGVKIPDTKFGIEDLINLTSRGFSNKNNREYFDKNAIIDVIEIVVYSLYMFWKRLLIDYSDKDILQLKNKYDPKTSILESLQFSPLANMDLSVLGGSTYIKRDVDDMVDLLLMVEDVLLSELGSGLINFLQNLTTDQSFRIEFDVISEMVDLNVDYSGEDKEKYLLSIVNRKYHEKKADV